MPEAEHIDSRGTGLMGQPGARTAVYKDSPARYSAVHVSVLMGFALYLIAFFLPGVYLGTAKDSAVIGWKCAWLALLESNTAYRFGGVINPLVLFSLLLRLLHRLPGLQSVLAVAILACMALMWVLVFRPGSGLMPGIGHVLWVVGIFLMLEPEIHDWKITLRVGG